jgi:hypothetical protein
MCEYQGKTPLNNPYTLKKMKAKKLKHIVWGRVNGECEGGRVWSKYFL